MSDSPEAGPSGTYAQTQSQTQAVPRSGMKKKARMSVNDMFAQPDAREKQRLGESLRDLQSKVDDDRANVANLQIEDFRRALEAQDAIFQDVNDTETGTLDAKLLASRADLVNQWSKQMHQNTNSFDTDEFLLRIRSMLGLDSVVQDEDEDELDDDDAAGAPRARRGRFHAAQDNLGNWDVVGWEAAKLYRRVPGVEFMYGPHHVAHNKRTVAQRAKKSALAPVVRPDEIVPQGKADKAEDISKFVKKIHRTLKKIDPDNQGVPFFNFAINPNSFGQSVENIFWTSFLIAEGKVGLEVGDDGEMIIADRDNQDPLPGHEGVRNQGVMEFDIEAWEMAKETFNITECIIPHREPKEKGIPQAGKWY